MMKSRNDQTRIFFKLLIISFLLLPFVSFASTTNGTIQTQYAWGENVGWVDLLPTGGDIHITDTAITGYAWDKNYGWINFAPSQSGVKNDSNGNLSGQAWSTGGGWINFSGVIINSSGKFTGTANGTVYGHLTFDCDYCNVTTDWRPANSRPSVSSSGSRGSSYGGGFFSSIYNYLFPSMETSSSNDQTSSVNGGQNTEVGTSYFDSTQDRSKLTSSTTNKNISQVKPYSSHDTNSISSMPIWKSILVVVLIALVVLALWRFVVLRI